MNIPHVDRRVAATVARRVPARWRTQAAFEFRRTDKVNASCVWIARTAERISQSRNKLLDCERTTCAGMYLKQPSNYDESVCVPTCTDTTCNQTDFVGPHTGFDLSLQNSQISVGLFL